MMFFDIRGYFEISGFEIIRVKCNILLFASMKYEGVDTVKIPKFT